jgi:hypothetical protein
VAQNFGTILISSVTKIIGSPVSMPTTIVAYKDNRFYFAQQDTFVNRGGLAEFRNIDAEKRISSTYKGYLVKK